ncbi:hypothetical protein PIB30_103286, partial [Stylosanthes scabra]|nr:hypothetical protein [Stylosanthes scabra]
YTCRDLRVCESKHQEAGELTLRVHDEQVIFNVFKAMQHPNEAESCMRIDIIDSLIQDVIEDKNSSDADFTILNLASIPNRIK